MMKQKEKDKVPKLTPIYNKTPSINYEITIFILGIGIIIGLGIIIFGKLH